MNLEHYPEELERVFAKISDLLVERGVEPKPADEAAFRITEFMRSEWGGLAVYFRKPKCRDQGSGTGNQNYLFPIPDPPSPVPDLRDYHAQLSAHAVGILTDLGLEPLLGLSIADLVRDDWSGSYVYVNQGVSYEAFLRDYQIWREWDGSHRSKVELLKKYRISDVWFYKIIKRVRQREFRRTQPVLPGVVGESR